MRTGDNGRKKLHEKNDIQHRDELELTKQTYSTRDKKAGNSDASFGKIHGRHRRRSGFACPLSLYRYANAKTTPLAADAPAQESA
jgi:hypothetical protein